jgi:ABC-2 type transport system permease protein
VIELLRSSEQSWTRMEASIQPDFESYPQLGFPVGSAQQRHTLAVSVQGSFESAFKDKPSPFEEGAAEEETGAEEAAAPTPPPSSRPTGLGTIESSPEAARLIVIGSLEFVDDVVFDLSSSLTRDRYLNSLQFLQNCVAWSTEDLDLLEIRSRGTQARVLAPLSEREQSFWEGGNYAMALLALTVIGIVWNSRRRNEEPMELLPPDAMAASAQSTGAVDAQEVTQ